MLDVRETAFDALRSQGFKSISLADTCRGVAIMHCRDSEGRPDVATWDGMVMTFHATVAGARKWIEEIYEEE